MRNFLIKPGEIANEQGNVTIEFVGVVVALFIPISYISIAALSVATTYIDIQNAARTGARIFVTSRDDGQARFRASQAVEAVLTGEELTEVKIICSNSPCLTSDGQVEVQVRSHVDLDLPSPFSNLSIDLVGSQTEVVQAIL